MYMNCSNNNLQKIQIVTFEIVTRRQIVPEIVGTAYFTENHTPLSSGRIERMKFIFDSFKHRQRHDLGILEANDRALEHQEIIERIIIC